MSCTHCGNVHSQRRGIVLKSFWSSIGYSFQYTLRFVAQERGSGNGHVAWSVALKMLVQVWNRVGKITYFALNKSWENHILWPKTEGLGFQNVFSSQTWKVQPRGQTPNSYSLTSHEVVFEPLPRLSQYLRISSAISSGDLEWSFPMPRELGQRFGKLSFDSATWKDIWSMVTKYCLQLYYLSLLSVTIPVLDKEKK